MYDANSQWSVSLQLVQYRGNVHIGLHYYDCRSLLLSTMCHGLEFYYISIPNPTNTPSSYPPAYSTPSPFTPSERMPYICDTALQVNTKNLIVVSDIRHTVILIMLKMCKDGMWVTMGPSCRAVVESET